ncbi:hypothetical protein M9458_021035, partial [Cirrhinus mrigala]
MDVVSSSLCVFVLLSLHLNTASTEALRSSFREQTRHLQDEHCSTVETLQQQISRLEAQLFQLQKEPVST